MATKNKGQGGLISSTKKKIAKRRVQMQEQTGVPNTPIKKRSPKPAPKKKTVMNKNKAFTVPKKSKAKGQAELAALRKKQAAKVAKAKKKTKG